jgi:protein-S-isoprenylcysteine O-methyltransferase Ste14
MSRSLEQRRRRAAAGSFVFLVLVPGVVAGLGPWWVAERTGGADMPLGARVAGIALVVTGAALLLHAFAAFVVEGAGTPAPVAPTERLVVGGLYRHVRNPMYLAVGAIIVGQALISGSVALVVYAAVFFAVVDAFVRWHEEPALARRYGGEYDAYRADVRRWRPRVRPRSP